MSKINRNQHQDMCPFWARMEDNITQWVYCVASSKTERH